PPLKLVVPAVRERAPLQLPLQPLPLPGAQPFHRDRPLRAQRVRTALLPLPPPTSHRPRRHPKPPRNGLGLLTASEPLGRLKTHPLPLFLLPGRQPATMRVPHDDVIPQRSRTVTGHRTPRVQPEYL